MNRTFCMHLIVLFVLCFFFGPAALANMKREPDAAKEGNTIVDGIVAPENFKKPSLLSKRNSHLPGKIIMKLKEGKTISDVGAIQEKHALKISPKKLWNTSYHRFRNLYDVRVGTSKDISAVIDELMGNPAVDYAEPVTLAYTQLVPNDPLFPLQWSHQKTQAALGWDITTGSPDIVIAVVDTGIAYDHPDLAPSIWHDPQGNPGKDFVDINTKDYTNLGYQLIAGEDYQTVDNDPSDYYGHGTHVAGIIAAAGNNGLGVVGVCPMCRVMPVRAGFAVSLGGQDYGVLQSDEIADAIIYAVDNGARVINMSFGGENAKIEKDAIDYADSLGVVLVAAAGNGGISTQDYAYPAAYENVLAVASTGLDDAKASYSNYGSWIGVAAPGGDWFSPILSTVPTGGSLSDPSGYLGLYGTSMASPYAAGLAGLILSKNPSWNKQQVIQAIRQGVDVFNIDIRDSPYYIGTGRVNVYKALQINTVSTALANITFPENDFITGSSFTLTGSATAPYRVMYGHGIYPSAWTEFGSGQATTGALASFDGSSLTPPFDNYTLKLVAENEDGKVEKIVQGRIGTQFLPGWPQTYSFDSGTTAVWNSPNMADIDNDGFNEIIITGQDGRNRGIINVFKHDGTQAAGNWPQNISETGSSFDFGAVVGDLQNDGNPVIIASALGQNPSLKAWDRFGNLLWSTVLEAHNPTLNITLADINGDGKLEIITQAYNSNLYVLDYKGNIQWSYPVNEYDPLDQGKTVAVVDLDGDGKKEIAKNVITNHCCPIDSKAVPVAAKPLFWAV